MKQLIYCLAFFALIFTFTACEGDPGPQGPPGFDGFNGEDGGLIVSSAFEIEVDFNTDNDFEFQEPYGFEVLPSDVTLVYILWETDNGEDVWRLMPQTVIFDEGSLIYNFDFTQSNVRFFLDGNIDFGTLDSSFTLDQVFRVVVVPADNIDGIDFSNLNLLSQTLQIEDFEIR